MAKQYKYRYETHIHTCSVSKCARGTVEDQVKFYASIGYDGIFITDHFMRGNCIVPRDIPWEEQVDMYCSSYEEGVELGKKYGIKVFFGVEISTLGGCDLLVYGVTKDWIKAHPELMTVSQEGLCDLVHESGGFIVHAHPFREGSYIHMASLLPGREDGIEIFNPACVGLPNKMAKIYAKEYGIPMTAGSDNHSGPRKTLFGFESKVPLNCEADYLYALKNGLGRPFQLVLEEQ